MEKYQIISLCEVFFIYCVALVPTVILAVNKKNYQNKKIFFKTIFFSILFESLIFSLIYIFPEEITAFFSNKPNIQNYSTYCLKILFIASSISGTHLLFPLYLYFYNQKKKSFLSFSFKLFYIPIIIIGYFLFNTKGSLFAIPLCDLLYSLFLVLQYKYSVQKIKQ